MKIDTTKDFISTLNGGEYGDRIRFRYGEVTLKISDFYEGDGAMYYILTPSGEKPSDIDNINGAYNRVQSEMGNLLKLIKIAKDHRPANGK